MDNDELYHKIVSELLFSRAVMSFVSMLVLFAVVGKKDVVAYLGLYAALCLVKSCVEHTKGC